VPAATWPLPLPADAYELIRRLIQAAAALGVDVHIGAAARGLQVGYTSFEDRRIVIYGQYSPQAQAIELAHQVTHIITYWGQPDCWNDRAQGYEQVAESVAVLLASRLGWNVDREGETLWSPSLTEQHHQELLPYVASAAEKLGRILGVDILSGGRNRAPYTPLAL
jgi:hypothetical protein